jgi:hypothetical protein
MKKKKRGKWDNLKKNKNLKLRRDYINTHYINGMDSITGDKKLEGLRELTSEEKDYLSDFYGEYINASFNEDSLMKTSETNKAQIIKLKKEYKDLEKVVSNLDPIKDMNKRNPLAKRMVTIKSELIELDIKKDSYNRNNARNRCVLNKGKAINTVEFRNWGELDQDTIGFVENNGEDTSLNYDQKIKLFKHLNKNYPGMFTFDQINEMTLELIYEILSTRG